MTDMVGMFSGSIGPIITGVLMGFAFIGMLYCAKKQKENPNMQAVAIGLLIVIVGLGLGMLWQTGVIGPDETKRLMAREMKYAEYKALVFGQDVASKFPGRKALIITSQSYGKNKRQDQIVESLKEGLGSSVTVEAVKAPPLPKPPPGQQVDSMTLEMMPLEEMMTAECYNQLIDQYPKCDLLIFTQTLPYDYQRLKIWSQPPATRPKVALLNGDLFTLKDGIKEGYINLLVSYKPDIKYEEKPCPNIPRVAFDERYIIVTPENYEATVEKYPTLFGLKKPDTKKDDKKAEKAKPAEKK